MKKLLLLLISTLSLSVYGQDIENLFDGIKTIPLPGKYVAKITNSCCTDLKIVSNETDSATFEYMIGESHKNILVNVFASNTSKFVKSIVITDKKGLIVIDKTKLLPGYYDIAIFEAGELRLRDNFSKSINTEIQKQVGNYLFYWKGTQFMFKYIGSE